MSVIMIKSLMESKKNPAPGGPFSLAERKSLKLNNIVRLLPFKKPISLAHK